MTFFENLKKSLPDCLSLGRLFLSIPLFSAAFYGHALPLTLIMAAGALSDILDGAAARRYLKPQDRKPNLDMACDAVFLLSGLCGLWLSGRITFIAPLLTALSFALYLLQRAVTGNKGFTALGRYTGGVLYSLLILYGAILLIPASRSMDPGFYLGLAACLFTGLTSIENILIMVKTRGGR